MKYNIYIILSLILTILILSSCSKTAASSQAVISSGSDINSESKNHGTEMNKNADWGSLYEYVDAKGFVDNYGNSYGDDGIVITRYIGTETIVYVPSEIDGQKVAGNVDDAFYKINDEENAEQEFIFDIKELYFSDDYPDVNCGLFNLCKSLEYIELPKAQKTIQAFSFKRCENLKGITCYESLESIEKEAFHGCESLTEFEFNNGLKTIGDEAFGYCEKLESLDLPDTVESMGNSVFKCCNSLTEISIPGSIQIIPKRAFFGCKNLQKVNLSEGIQEIGDEAFSICESLKDIYIPDSVTKISVKAFDRDTDLVIHCSKDSYAMKFAAENSLKCSES